MNRIDRLVAFLTLLQSKKYVTVEHVAERYAISERTVFRDLRALGEMGVPIYFDKNKGYSILPSFFLSPVSLSTEEANAIVLLTSLAQKFGDKTTKDHADAAINKIKAVLNQKDKEKADFLHSQIRVYQPPDQTPSPDYLTEIQQSIIDRQVLQIEYVNNDEKRSIREIEPIGLTFYSNQWHLIAWCWLRETYRDFKVSQILQLDNLKQPFRKSDHLDIDQYIKSIS